jgi:glycosyltransferase involved in cell wall biosynthesis
LGPGGHSAIWKKEAPLTVAYHAPPPGSHSGVADYAETLTRALRRFGQPPMNLYHLGNNKLHAQIYADALETPGVIVLHDAVLHHFMLGALSHEQYIAEWIYNYGEWQRSLGEELWRDRAKCGADPRYFEFPLLRRIVERSRAVIVHNPGAAAVASQFTPNVAIIPHFCEIKPAVDACETVRFRERIAVGQGATLFGIFGYLREPKRIVTCIQAFKRLHAQRPDTALLIAGECVSSDLARLLEIEVNHPAIRRLAHLSERDFPLAMAAVDCCLNLRYPGAGETSGIAIRLMGMGKPVIVTDNAENSAFPPGAALRVSPGVAESAELFDHICLVTEFPPIAREIGNEAQRHIREHHALESVAGRYWNTLCAAIS